MTDDALIALQARRIAALEEQIADYQCACAAVRAECVAVGGPLNDNAKGYTPEQLRDWQRVLNAVEGVTF